MMRELYAPNYPQKREAALLRAAGRCENINDGRRCPNQIGMLKIMELRHKAERELGAKFDIKAYDDLVVGEGSVPLTVLEHSVDDWIARVKASGS